MSPTRGTVRQYGVAVRLLLVFTVLLGIAYPLAVTGVGRLAFPSQSTGSLLSENGQTVGSVFIGQSFTDAKGNPLAQWFQSRPSAAGYDPHASGGTNLGPDSTALVSTIDKRRAAIAKFDGVDPSAVPADALTSSASGLDADISPAYARIQIARVAQARGLDESDVARLVASKIQNGDLGYLSEPTVNVLELNLALARLK